MKIGDTVYWFDVNRRVYATGQSAPVWRKHWEPVHVVGETSRSWVLRNGTKLPKADPFGGGAYLANEQEVDDVCWLHEHRHHILRKISYRPPLLTPAEVAYWRALAKLIGYNEETQR